MEKNLLRSNRTCGNSSVFEPTDEDKNLLGTSALIVVIIYFVFFGFPLAYNSWHYLYKQSRYKTPILLGFYLSAFALFVSRVV
jgi:hypothetical protein